MLDQEAFVLRVRKNAVVVLVPRFGVEGPVYVADKESVASFVSFSPSYPSLSQCVRSNLLLSCCRESLAI